MTTLADIWQARPVVMEAAIRTPLVRLQVEDAPGEIWLKLENLQPIGSFKLRGAWNAMRRMSPEELSNGVVAASAGNMAQGVAFAARAMGIPATIIAPDNAPEAKEAAVRRMGGEFVRVPREVWWETFQRRSYPGLEDRAFVHAFDDDAVMAGNGTIALEILEDLPQVTTVIAPFGGGGLASSIAIGMRALAPDVSIYAAEVETAAPLAASFAAAERRTVDYQNSFVDGIGSTAVFPRMWDLANQLLDASLVVSVAEAEAAVRLMAERQRVIAEGAAGCAVAAALSGRAGAGVTVCIVSGGNIDFGVLQQILRQ